MLARADSPHADAPPQTAAQRADGAHATLAGVTRHYPGTPPLHALGPIDLALAAGEFFAVVGPSGCGKSTLLDVLAGLSAPSAGSVTFEGRPVSGGVPDGVGVVFQEDASFPWLTVADNVAFGLRRAGVNGKEVARRVAYAIDFMGLRDFARAYPAQLSGGMRQRVCIARTLVTQPRLILLDEPFGALDQQTRLLMGDELLRLWRETGATVLLITHALDEAAMLSDRVGVMSSRPGRFIDMVTTGWPRDRDSRIVADAAFGAITARLWSCLRAESLKAMGRDPQGRDPQGRDPQGRDPQGRDLQGRDPQGVTPLGRAPLAPDP
jgi:NitT/TauT family transport system ATP-binding protein